MASTINITKSSPGNIIITGKWTWYDYYKVEYSWENAPDGVTLPETINKIKNGSIIAVDTTYSSSSEVNTNDYYYTFSGWNKSGNITVNADTTITGIWTQNRYLTVSYSWTDAPSNVILPSTVNKLKPNDTVTVDTTYNSDSEVDTDTCYYTFSGWNQTGDIIVTSDTVISGVWTIHDYLKVSYSWTNAPSSVTLPKTVTKLKPGDSVTIDTTYTSDSTVDINYTWTKGTISSTTSYTCVCYGNGKFVAGARMTKSNTSFAYSTDGINWTESTISDTNRDWRSICYGNGKFVAVGTKFTSSSSSTTSMGRYSAYSTDGITWTLKTLNSSGNIPESVCYGNDKFVAVGDGYIGYSTDGISWTSTNTSRYWTSVCYGNGKFVAVAENSNYFAYSTDGITWTESTISDTSRYWYSVCYGNDKFVAVANKSYFAYSTDGITWTEGTISSTSRSWGCICYGNGKFVAVATNTIYFAYSTDGITWTESTISDTSRSWHSVCYGNPNNKDIYIAVDVNQTYYYSNLSGNEYYYSFSGWDKTGNITVTKDTVISGVWTIHDYLKVSYSWSNAPSSVTLPKTVTKLKPGDNVTVDTTYNSSSEVDTNDYYYTFSGWNKSGNITVNADTTITGIWTQNKYLTVSYSWTDAPNGVTLPNSTTKLKPGDSVTVDTTYNSSSIKELDPSVKIGKISSSSTSRHWKSVCYGNGKFIAVSNSSNYFAYSTNGINWTEGTISSTARQWRSVCYGNGKFVAVANDTNYFAYSTDGITWTEGTISSANRDWWSVCYGNGKFVAVANNSTYFAYSTDGITWTEGTISSTRRYWRSVCYGNNKYVAVGSHIEASGGTYSYFAYSTDGITWTEGTISSTSRQWQGVCYGNDKFVAVAYSSNYSAYSTNGINWTESTISSDSTNLQSVCYGNGKFVAVGSNSYLYYSTDGIKWKIEIIHNAKIPWQEVCYGNNKFVAVDKDNNEYFAYFTDSTYYYQFSGWNQTGNITVTKDTVISGVWSQKNYLTVSYSWTDAPTNLMSTVPDSCGGFKPGDTYIVDSNYTSNTAKKDIDGWTEGTISGTSRDWMSVCYGNGKFVAVAENSNYFAYSTNGITWTEGTISGTSRDWMSVCYGNGKFVAVGYNLTSNSVLLTGNDFAYSTDGITWTEGTISGTNRQWYSVCYGNSKFVLVAYNDNYFAYSTDGINWTESTISDTERYWRSVCYSNGKFVAVASSSNYFAYSTDGITWTEGTISSTSRNWYSVCYGNGKFVAVASSSNYFAYSTDGITWTETSDGLSSRNWRSVCYGNGIFVAIAYNSNYFAYSTNGINWTEGTISDTSRKWRSVCYGNNKLVAVAYNSNYFSYSSLYDIFYIFSGWNKTGNITLNDNTVITGKWSKKELITISSRHITEISSTGREWYSVCYGNGKFVAVANNSNYFAYSTNGTNWTEGTISSTSRKWQSVCYGNGMFVAVAYNTNYFAYSTNGTNWTEGTISDTSRNWQSVCYGNGKFVAVASSSNYFAYSSNGINWTEGTISSTSRKWYSVCYGNDRFVTIGYHETSSYPSWSATAYAAYSTDGITWTENVYGPYSNDAFHRWTNICYGNNIFVVTGNGSTYYSTDGITWTASGCGVAKSNDVCYNNGIFVSVGNDTYSGHKTQYVSYSTNGIRWNTTSSSPSDIIVWDSVCYGNGKFVAVGHMVNDEFNYDLVDGNNVMYFYCNLNFIN